MERSRRLHPTGGVLGVHEGFAYEECGLELHAGDLLLLYTDGVTEAENANGEMFDEERLVEYLRERRDHKPLEDLLNNLHHEVQRFTGKGELEDDYTVIALRKLT